MNENALAQCVDLTLQIYGNNASSGRSHYPGMCARTILGLVVVAGMIAAVALQRSAMNRVQSQNGQLRQQIEAVPDAAPAHIVPDNALSEAERTELLRLRGEVAQLRREREALSRRLAAQTNAVKRAVAAEGTPDQTWVTQMLNAPAAQQGALAGAVRSKMLKGGQELTASELALRDALAQRDMNSLEKTPGDFADFQSAFIESAVGLSAEKTRQIRDIILRTYERAVANGLDIPSKPATGAEDWVNQRHQLDRRSTSAVQKLLTPEERQARRQVELPAGLSGQLTGSTFRQRYPSAAGNPADLPLQRSAGIVPAASPSCPWTTGSPM